MAFYERKFSERWDAMGDESEATFESVATEGVAPFGLNRPPVRVADLPQVIRYMPDRLQSKRLVECMGIGKDYSLKLKLDKLFAQQWWNTIHPTELFIWNSHAERWAQVPISDVAKQCQEKGTLLQFPEGKPYWRLDVRDLGWEWTRGAAA